MRPYAFLWVLLGPNGSLCVLKGPLVFLCVLMRLYGF